MCGRYYVGTEEEIAEMREILEEINRKYADSEKHANMRTGEIFPTNLAPVISEDGPTIMKWGFPMHGSSQTAINARSETAAQKPMFSAALRQRRVVIPTTGFYEWSHENGKSKDKFLFRIPGRKMLYLAGLHTNFARPDGTREDYFTILTTAANDSMRPYHDRMPVYVATGECKTWISDSESVGDILSRQQPKLSAIKVPKAGQMSFF
jgi:putative SOS response-associated peptidase YedK